MANCSYPCFSLSLFGREKEEGSIFKEEELWLGNDVPKWNVHINHDGPLINNRLGEMFVCIQLQS